MEIQSDKAGVLVSHGPTFQLNSVTESEKHDAGNHQVPVVSPPANPNIPYAAIRTSGLFAGSRSSSNSSIFSPSYQPSPGSSYLSLPSKRSKTVQAMNAGGSHLMLPAKRKKTDSKNHALSTFSFTVPTLHSGVRPVSVAESAPSLPAPLASSESLPALSHHGNVTTTESTMSEAPAKKRKIIIIRRPVSSCAILSSTTNTSVSFCPPSGSGDDSSHVSHVSSSSAVNSSVRAISTAISPTDDSLGVISIPTATSDKPNSVPAVTSVHPPPLREPTSPSAPLSDVPALGYSHHPSKKKRCEVNSLKDVVLMSVTTPMATAGVEEKKQSNKPLPQLLTVSKETAQGSICESKQDHGLPRKPSLAEVKAEM